MLFRRTITFLCRNHAYQQCNTECPPSVSVLMTLTFEAPGVWGMVSQPTVAVQDFVCGMLVMGYHHTAPQPMGLPGCFQVLADCFRPDV